ncbi:hypothetical protein GCM10023235_60000 [Kitasatospora terrestris]|uniref:Uncharacterized protein n=1 Tax=Kitasatospora terrestris TaxID=258051 RepID=A0ABP9ECA6_9ACTN
MNRLREALRQSPGWFVLAAGAVLCVLGWYGVSGERLAARQLPYLASATVPGAALLVGGAVLLAARLPGRGAADRRMDQLFALLVGEASADGESAEAAGGPPVAVPDGTLYHRADCPLVAGKAHARPVDAETVGERGLGACPVCEPAAPEAGGGAGNGAGGGAGDGTAGGAAGGGPAGGGPAGGGGG